MKTEGVATLLGDPKKAIIKLSIPMIVAMLVNSLYNVVDTFWIAGLGADHLAAIGFVFPLFIIMIAIANGIGTGGGAAISRFIGAKNKKNADNAAEHTLLFMILISVAFTGLLYTFAEQIISSMGSGTTTLLAVQYARIIFLGTIFMTFSFVGNAILRSEGNVKKAMIAMLLGTVLNLILDPIFIYTLDLGIAGAAWATVISMAVVSLILFYWLFLKNNIYLSFDFKNFKFSKELTKDIFKVGLPASFQNFSMALMMVAINFIIVGIATTDGVAVFSTGWRIATIAIMPIFGVATAVISVSAAAYGSKNYAKLKIAFLYAIKLCFMLELIIAAVLFLFAPFVAGIFTYSDNTVRIAADLIIFFKLIGLFYPAAAIAIISSAMFQGVGKGLNALIITFLRSIVFIIPAVWLLSRQYGLVGVWWGIVIGTILGSIVAIIWANQYITKLIQKS